jgi:hypothetical protein
VRLKLLKEELTAEAGKSLDGVADVSAGAWLDGLPIVSNVHLGDGDVVRGLLCQIGVCPASMQDQPVTFECGKPFSPEQDIRYRCHGGVRTGVP